MPDQVNMNIDQLDVLIADTARRAPQILPILRKVRAGEIGYFEITRNGARVLRLGAPGSRPMVTLIADPEGLGPVDFRTGFLRYALGQADAVAIVCDQQPDDLAYEAAAAHCADRRRQVLIIECPQQALGAWTNFAHECGQARDSVVAFVSNDRLPEGLGLVDVEDIPPATPSGPVH
jgi:hypothetical protein